MPQLSSVRHRAHPPTSLQCLEVLSKFISELILFLKYVVVLETIVRTRKYLKVMQPLMGGGVPFTRALPPLLYPSELSLQLFLNCLVRSSR